MKKYIFLVVCSLNPINSFAMDTPSQDLAVRVPRPLQCGSLYGGKDHEFKKYLTFEEAQKLSLYQVLFMGRQVLRVQEEGYASKDFQESINFYNGITKIKYVQIQSGQTTVAEQRELFHNYLKPYAHTQGAKQDFENFLIPYAVLEKRFGQ